MFRLIPWAIGAYMLYSFTTSKIQQIKDALHFGGTNVQVIEPTLYRTKLLIRQEITNRSPVSIPAENFSGYLYYKDSPIAPLEIPQPIDLPAGQTTTVNIHATVDHAKVLGNVLALITSGQMGGGNFKIIGKARKAGVEFPIRKTIEI